MILVSCSQLQTLPVVEKFISINGEGLESGRLAAFIRFALCNLDCSYCDTRWANDSLAEKSADSISIEKLVEWVRNSGVSAVTLTGGEPLLQPLLPTLIDELLRVDEPHALRVEVETNGSCDISSLVSLRNELRQAHAPGSLHLTVDWKVPSSGRACSEMLESNYSMLSVDDVVKFVVGTVDDIVFADKCIRENGLCDRCSVLLSPVWGRIQPNEVVDLMKRLNMHKVRLQMQLHKLIWPDVEKGV